MAGGLILPATSASAATSVYAYPSGSATAPTECPVASTPDEACSLEQALEVAVDGDTIVLAADPDGGVTFATETGWVVSQDSLAITADAGVAPVLDGLEVAPYLLDYTGAGTLSVDGITVANSIGSPDEGSAGGGIIVRGGTLDAQNSTFANNDVLAAGYGGGILVWSADSEARIAASTFVDNGGAAPAVFGGGIIGLAGGSITVTTSTFVDNGLQGAIRDTNLGTLNVAASTFVNNTYGISSGNVDAVVVGSVFAGHQGAGCAVTADAVQFDGGYNVDDDGSCVGGGAGSATAVEDLAATLGGLADNGGPTQTIAPTPGSPAIGLIPNGATVTVGGESVGLCPATDQRGVSSGEGLACSAGAVQGVGAPASIAVHAGNEQSADPDADFAAPLSALVLDSVGQPIEGVDVAFAVTSGDANFGGSASVTAQTDADGVATAPTLTAGSEPGAVAVEASVGNVADPAVFAATVLEPLLVLTDSLPDGQVGAEYSASLVASGASDGVYHWSIADGELPDGLSLAEDGTISGTPTVAGTFAFTVAVNDPAYADLTIVVQPAADTSAPSDDAAPASDEPPLVIGDGPDALAETGVQGVLPLGLGGVAMILIGGFALVLGTRSRVRR